MDTEKKSPIKCPACSAENPRNRLTCEVCGESLAETIAKMAKRSRKKKNEGAKTETPNPDSQSQEAQKPDMTLWKTTPLKPIKVQSSRPRKSHRRPKETPHFPLFFMFDGSKLKAVRVAFNITVPLRRKDLPKDARNLLSLWNRNKDIIKNA